MKGAMIGFGFIASQGHLPSLLAARALEIVAVADGCAARRAEAARLLPSARIYAGHDELLAREPALDFVDIATPPNSHVPIALAALDRGLHVICEKPIGLDSGEAMALVRAAQAAGRVVMPCHNYKYAPAVLALRGLIADGVLGRVRTVAMSTFRTTHARGTPEWNSDWRRDRSIAGGGIGMDHGSHNFYLAFMLMGGYPRSISGRVSAGEGFDTEDTVSCTLGYDHGEVSVYLSWSAAARKVIYSVHGEAGAALVDDEWLAVTGPNAALHDLKSDFDTASHAGWYGPLFADFAAAVARRDCSNAELIEAYHANLVIDLLYRSAALGGAELALEALPDGIAAPVRPLIAAGRPA